MKSVRDNFGVAHVVVQVHRYDERVIAEGDGISESQITGVSGHVLGNGRWREAGGKKDQGTWNDGGSEHACQFTKTVSAIPCGAGEICSAEGPKEA